MGAMLKNSNQNKGIESGRDTKGKGPNQCAMPENPKKKRKGSNLGAMQQNSNKNKGIKSQGNVKEPKINRMDQI